jgi:hypothetical protein
MWRRHTVDAIGLSIDLHHAWPILDFSPFGPAGVYQPIADTDGAVFVRYGAGQTLESYVQLLGDRLSTVSVTEEATQLRAGEGARRLDIGVRAPSSEAYFATAGDYPEHQTLPERHDAIAVIGFTHRDTPILVGYRIAAQHLARFRETLEHMLGSVELSQRP